MLTDLHLFDLAVVPGGRVSQTKNVKKCTIIYGRYEIEKFVARK
jgi:hypothetical protein